MATTWIQAQRVGFGRRRAGALAPTGAANKTHNLFQFGLIFRRTA
jgi:hypothetical protein